jgi:hypothetical protein
VDSKGRDVTVAVEGNIVRVRRDKRVAHDSVEGSVDSSWDFAEDDEITDFSFDPTGGVGTSEIEGLGPFGLEAVMLFRWRHDNNYLRLTVRVTESMVKLIATV